MESQLYVVNSAGKAACSLVSPSAEETKLKFSFPSGSVQSRRGYQLGEQAQSFSILPPLAESSERGKAVSRAFSEHHKCKKNQHNSLVHQLRHSLRNHFVHYLILRFL